MVTVKVLADVELHVSVAVWDGGRVTLDGVIAPQVRPAGTVSVKATVPEKVPTGLTVIVDVREELTGPVGEVAEMVKPPNVNVAVVE